MFTPKSASISPDCPFKSNQRLTKISFLTPQCAVWLWGAQFWAILITWLRRGMHTMELDYSVWSTPWSPTPLCNESDYFENVGFCVFVFITSFNKVLSQISWSKTELKMWWLTGSVTDFRGRGPGFKSSNSHNDPDALKDHYKIM